VEFHGAMPHHEMPEWFDRADILVNSSRIDNMPHVLIEAFAAGLPVVTTPAGGIPYVVEDGRNGFWVEIDDPGALAAAVERLLVDPALVKRLISAGRGEFEERYSWTGAERAWRSLYRGLLGLESARSGQSRAHTAVAAAREA
jgi:glycosyltransferase involved in cell wall biosynthesis